MAFKKVLKLKGIVGVAILVSILVFAVIMVGLELYIVSSRIERVKQYGNVIEDYKLKVLSSTKAYYIAYESSNSLNITVITPYRMQIVMILYAYTDQFGNTETVVDTSVSFIIESGRSSFIYSVSNIPVNNIISLKLVTGSGVVIPVPKVYVI